MLAEYYKRFLPEFENHACTVCLLTFCAIIDS